MSIDYERTTETAAYQAPTVARNDHTVTGRKVGSGGYSPTLQTSGTSKTGSPVPSRAADPKSRRSSHKVEPRVRQRCRLLFGSCVDHLNSALDTPDDHFIRYNALERLKDSFAELWDHRNDREREFAEVVNVLQGVIVEKDADNLSVSEIRAIRSACLRLHDEPVITRLVINDVALSLMEDGINVFHPLG